MLFWPMPTPMQVACCRHGPRAGSGHLLSIYQRQSVRPELNLAHCSCCCCVVMPRHAASQQRAGYGRQTRAQKCVDALVREQQVCHSLSGKFSPLELRPRVMRTWRSYTRAASSSFEYTPRCFAFLCTLLWRGVACRVMLWQQQQQVRQQAGWEGKDKRQASRCTGRSAQHTVCTSRHGGLAMFPDQARADTHRRCAGRDLDRS